MLNSIQAQQLHRFGVANIDEQTGDFTPIVPIKYNMITFHPNVILAKNADGTSDAYTLDGHLIFEHKIPVLQKYGIIAKSPDGMSDAYTYDGKIALQRGFNIFFLDNYLLLVSAGKNCYIFNYQTKKMVSAKKFESILFFCGSNTQAQPYTPSRDMMPILVSADYQRYGAHLEQLVCAKLSSGWGVYNFSTKTTYASFAYKVIVHCKGLNIGAIDQKGNQVALCTGTI